MSDNRTKDRRSNDRAFRPTLDGSLESRLLLSQGIHALRDHPLTRAIPGHYIFQVAHGGNILQVTTPTGDVFNVTVLNGGSVRGHALRNGTVTLTVQGTNDLSVIDINPLTPVKFKGSAHTFDPQSAISTNVLKIGSLTVTSGKISQINGYHTADLYGPIKVESGDTVDRIALNSIKPGGSISVAGILNTLDVATSATFDGSAGSTGLNVGLDLNSFSVGTNLTATNGADIVVNRDLGLFPQLGKGTGPAGQGVSILGNLTLSNGSAFKVGRSIEPGATFVVYGFTAGYSNLLIPGGVINVNVFLLGGGTP